MNYQVRPTEAHKCQVSKEYADKPETIELIPYLAKMMHSGDPAMVEAACTTAWYVLYHNMGLQSPMLYVIITNIIAVLRTNVDPKNRYMGRGQVFRVRALEDEAQTTLVRKPA